MRPAGTKDKHHGYRTDYSDNLDRYVFALLDLDVGKDAKNPI